ncbi:MAG TPA: arginase family protein [Thermoanaerobaculia bacterium]|nr:arginase family protein [Thermoanaerobaculia bacterium]
MCLIEIPYMIGDNRHGASKGPQRYVQAAEKRLAVKGVAVTVERIERGKPFRDSPSASMAVNKQLEPVVRQAIAAGRLPLVLAGSCDVCMGILAGFDHARCGVVWFDAHGDFNTPDSTITGFFAGMSLAVITGHCYQKLWAQIGDSAPISEAATLMLGVRDLDPAERERLERSAIQVVHWHGGRPQADVLACLDQLTKHVEEVYLHVDLDAFDPDVAPGIVDDPVPGGLSLHDMEEAIRAVTARFRIRAAALTTYNPELDQDDKTLRAGLRIIELVAEHAGDRGQTRALNTRG